MIIGIPKELKENEYRVGTVPDGVRAFTDEGHAVLVERGAGDGSQISDKDFLREGAAIVKDHEEIFERSDIIIKVKEPVRQEYQLLKKGKILYSFLHLASEPALTDVLLKSGITAIAYETLQKDDRSLPLLTPMSEIAGKISIQEGARFLKRDNGGRGVLLGGATGVEPAKVMIVGAGTAGLNAARIALGMGANVSVFDINSNRLRYIDSIFNGRVTTLFSSFYNLKSYIKTADLVVGAVLIPGGKAPRIITRSMISLMKKGAVVVDVSIDQGGCIETSRPTSHSDPVFSVDGVIHYCVANIPGVIPVTSTYGLSNATIPYALFIAKHGLVRAVKKDKAIKKGVNIFNGNIVHKVVASSLKLPYVSLDNLL